MKLTRLATLLLLLGPVSCRSSERSASVPAPPDPMQSLPGDPDVEADLETLDVRTPGSGSERRLEFEIRNKTSDPIRFAWAVEWFDRAGVRIAGSARAWNQTTLEGGAKCAVQVPMPSLDASSWRLRAVRPGANTLTQGVSR